MADMVIVDAARDDRRPMAPAARLGADALVRRWLDEGRRSDDGSALFADGVAALERILRALLPRAAALWPNYPNPFNPETWIPFDLTEPASVTVTIYDVAGSLIREIRVGWTPAGTYRESRRAAHWDGRNTYGEQVASGVYVYELRAGAYRAARRMIVRK
ncbi:T9SS type A sorting domain-containing protein, partial [Candidatus Poribacteria bacterium]|nr:T9SS type A sorting domain-containing protein [Candidatus Poribacteria bacterium]